MVQDIVDLTQCSSDSDDDDDGAAVQTEEIVLTHVKKESVRFSKGNVHVKC